jgi:hypothetical protein
MEPCKFEDKINETHKIVTGNGNPEVGLGRQVALIGERQQGVLKTLAAIEPKIDGLIGAVGKLTGEDIARKNMWRNILIVIGFLVTIGVALWSRSGISSTSIKLDKVKDNQDTMKMDIKKSETRGIVIIPVEKFDIKRHAAIADSLINAMNK